ncbi:MAG: redoxin family protein [Bacteroides sp.]|nr:redoxin family protein [Bacteroides sp.]
MKLSHLFIAGLLLLASCTPENRVIENPVYFARNNNTIEVSKISLTDSTTVLDIQATYTPGYWIKIVSNTLLTDDKGNIYPLTSSNGIDLDKEFWMPESGEATFQLVFPPLKRGAKTIDFIEGSDAADGSRIWNIQLKETTQKISIPKEFTQTEVDKNAPLTEPAFIYGPTTIKGKVLGYTKGMPDKITIEDYSPFYGSIRGNEYPETTLDEDGSFSYTINLLGMTRISLNYAENYIQIWGMPNETSEVYINMPEITRRKSKIHADKASYGEAIYYNGPWESLVMENAKKSTIVYDTSRELSIPHQELLNTSFEAFKANEIKIYETIIEKANQSDLSQATKDYIKVEAAARMMSSLIMAPDNYINIYQRKELMNNKSEEEILAGWKKMSQTIPADFYQLPKELEDLLNSTIAITTNPYPSLLRINGDTSTMKEGLLKSMNKTLAIINDLNSYIPLTDEQREEMKSLPEACQQYLNDANEKLLATIEANKKKEGYNVNEVGEVANEKLFESIISKFRGKVLLVDFWATWCGPCRAANKEMKPMKETLKEKDIVYVYITGETSDKPTWEQMIPDLHGEHFYLTQEQWEYLGNSLDISGVPTYYIIDREGNTAFRSVGYPDTSKIKEELEKAL